MSVENLQRVLPAPSNPIGVPGLAQWQVVENQFAVLPDDFHAFIDMYGAGVIDDFIWVFVPALSNPNLNFERQVSLQLSVVEGINKEGLEPPMTSFPNQGGILPFGITENGDVLFWETTGNAEEWTVCVLAPRSSPLEKFGLNMSDFLAGVCAGDIDCRLFPNDFPSQAPAFNPII